MEANGLNGGSNFDDERALKGLLEAFGREFSLELIASAYCKAGKNADAAAEALSLSGPNGEAKPKAEEEWVPLSRENLSKKSYQANGYSREKSYQANGNPRAPKPRYRPVSVGSVSNIIGNQCVKKTQPVNGSCDTTKPLKLDSTVLPMSEIWVENDESNSSRDDRLHLDMEDFLFQMLGDGFNLERDRIRQVLDSCGYDMEKSMEKLISFPESSSDKRDKLVSKSSDKSTDLSLKSDMSSERSCKNFTKEDRASNTNGVECTEQQKKRNDLQKEVLADLFSFPKTAMGKPKELPRRILKAGNRCGAYGAYGGLVNEPPEDFISECKTAVMYQQHHGEDDADDEDSYQFLRKTVKEYRSTMKEYYEAAAEAFAKGDHVLANKLSERGCFFRDKAREADEESNEMILKTRKAEAEDGVVVDLQEFSGKESIRLLKRQISSFSGISIKYLKVIIDTKEEDISKGSRRRMLVLKLLEEESIKWTEGDNAGTILIQLDSINPKRLTFHKKY